MSKLSFDGFRINGRDKYRARIATFANDEAGKAYGKLFEAAPDLLAALEGLLHGTRRAVSVEDHRQEREEASAAARAAIAKARGTK